MWAQGWEQNRWSVSQWACPLLSMPSREGYSPDAFLLPPMDILMKLVTTAPERSQAKARAGEESEAAAREAETSP